MELFFRFNRFFPYGIPPILTMLICIFIASLTIRAGRIKGENRLLTLYFILQAFYTLIATLKSLIASPVVAQKIIQLGLPFCLFIIPITVLFFHQVLNLEHRKWIERIAWSTSLLFLPLTQTRYFVAGIFEYPFGFFIKAGPALHILNSIYLSLMIYILIILIKAMSKKIEFKYRIKISFLLIGIFTNSLLTVCDFIPSLGINMYPPSNWGFLPIGVIAYGLVQYQLLDISDSWFKKIYFLKFLSIGLWLPLICAIGLLLFAPKDIFHENWVRRIINYGIPPAFSSFVCLGLATFCFLKGRKSKETNLFGGICVLTGFYMVDITLRVILKNEEIALQVARISHFFLVNFIGLYIHFIYNMLNLCNRKLIFGGYAFGILMIPLTQTNFYFQKSMNCYYFGLIAKVGWAEILFASFALLTLIWGSILLFQSWKRETDNLLKQKIIYLFFGLTIVGFLNLGNMPAALGIEFYPIGSFSFIPLLLMAYGVFQHDVIKINVYSKKRLIRNLSSIGIITGYLILIPVGFWMFDHISFEHFKRQILSYGIPPLLSLICCVYLSLLSLRLGHIQKELILFSLICLTYGYLNYEVLSNIISTDPSIALKVIRFNHFFFVFILPFALHLIFIVTSQKRKLWVIYFLYGISAIMAPLSQTYYYFQGTYSYHWGFAGHRGILFDFMVACWFFGIIYATFLFYQAYKETEDISQKYRVRYLFLGFVGSAILVCGNVPAIYGYELYPLSSFMFIPLLQLAYGLFSKNLKETLQVLKIILYWCGLLFLLIASALLSEFIFPEVHKSWLIIFKGTFLIGTFMLTKIFWKGILNLFFGQKEAKLKQMVEYLSKLLSTTQSMEKIYQHVSNAILEELLSIRFAMLWVSPDLQHFIGLERWNSHQGFFASPKKFFTGEYAIQLEAGYPLIPFFETSSFLIDQECMEDWITSQNISLKTTDRLREAELIQPIFFEKRLTSLLIIDPKTDGSLYSKTEMEFIVQIGLTLAPCIENAKLIQGLEQKVAERTEHLREMLHEIQKQKQEIDRKNQIFQSLIETSIALHRKMQLEELFSFTLDQIRRLFGDYKLGIILEGERPQVIKCVVFSGVSEDDQKVLLRNYTRLLDLNTLHLFPENTFSPQDKWHILPLIGERQVLGKLLINGALDSTALEIMTLFLELVSLVTQNRILTQELERMANTDGLTGAFNRLYFDRELEQAVHNATLYPDIIFSVFLIDINGLKQVNDLFGHEAGDVMIIKVANLLKKECRKIDVLSRIGGDEFAILCPSTDYIQAENLLKRIRQSEAQACLTYKNSDGGMENIEIHMSIGLASSKDTPPNEVLKKSDQLMYEDKEAYYAVRERYR
ncbi:MAG: diguanylate cyclase [Desulfobacterales bacterium]|nr:diguanylate cyclase [Desulfobacterales bacterium]